MTPQAQNALLKVFEEPPAGVHIILLAQSADLILSTVKSRAQYLQTEIFTSEKLDEYLCKNLPAALTMKRMSPDKFNGLLLYASGIIGKAKEAVDTSSARENEAMRESVLKILCASSAHGDFATLYSAFFALPQKREELKDVLEMLTSALRDVAVLSNCKDAPAIFFISRDEYETYSKAISLKRAIKIQKIISDCISDIDKNVVIPMLLSDVCARIHGIR
jgi:DNA polymerase-3 subunit delta'